MDPALLAETARNMMVDSQVRPNKVADPRIIAAMRRLPREHFLPPSLAARAYADEDVDLGGGRCLIEPMVIARLIQEATPRAGERALVVAAGAGYGAAILAACDVRVTALEDDPALLALARNVLPAWAPTVVLLEGPPDAGAAQGAPWDLIVIEGAVETIPPALVAQLAPLGRLLAIRSLVGAASAGCSAQAVIGEPVDGRLSLQSLFDCAVPPLPALRRAAGFVF